MTTENLSLLETKHLVEKSRGKLTMLVLRDDRKFLVSIPEVEDSPQNSADERRQGSSSELEGECRCFTAHSWSVPYRALTWWRIFVIQPSWHHPGSLNKTQLKKTLLTIVCHPCSTLIRWVLILTFKFLPEEISDLDSDLPTNRTSRPRDRRSRRWTSQLWLNFLFI